MRQDSVSAESLILGVGVVYTEAEEPTEDKVEEGLQGGTGSPKTLRQLCMIRLDDILPQTRCRRLSCGTGAYLSV